MIRALVEKAVVKLLKRIVAELPSRTITSPDGSPYLTRWYLWPRGPRTDDSGAVLVNGTPVALFVHYFHRGDEDRELHNHPWAASLAIILAGGYRELRESGWRTFTPGMINVIAAGDYHRVELLHPERGSWSLFVAGRNVGSWGFRDNETGEHIPHHLYLARKYGN